MKKQFRQLSFAILTTLIFLIGIMSVSAAVRPNLVISEYSIKEGSVNAGKDFTLSLTLKNLEDPCANTITTTVTANPPFIQKGVSTKLVDTSLCDGASTVVDIPLKIDPLATGGTYQVVITSTYESVTSAAYTSTSTLNIYVNGTPKINANLINSNPLDVYAGDTATISFNIENDGSFEANAVSASLSITSPLSVVWSKSLNLLSTIDSKQSKIADFSVEVPKNANAGNYPMTLKITYLNENRELVSEEVSFAFKVKEKALFETTDSGTDTLYPGENSKMVRLLLKNIGTADAKKVQIKMLPQFPFSTDGSVRYIDVLQKGKDSEVYFTVDVDKDATPGTYGINMLLNFEDSQGKSMQDKTIVYLTVNQKSTTRAVFIDYWYLWAIFGLILLISILRRRSKSEKKKFDKN